MVSVLFPSQTGKRNLWYDLISRDWTQSTATARHCSVQQSSDTFQCLYVSISSSVNYLITIQVARVYRGRKFKKTKEIRLLTFHVIFFTSINKQNKCWQSKIFIWLSFAWKCVLNTKQKIKTLWSASVVCVLLFSIENHPILCHLSHKQQNCTSTFDCVKYKVTRNLLWSFIDHKRLLQLDD